MWFGGQPAVGLTAGQWAEHCTLLSELGGSTTFGLLGTGSVPGVPEFVTVKPSWKPPPMT
jgi:hypothetical protein